MMRLYKSKHDQINYRTSQCQLYLDVDCSSITYDTKPSSGILEAVEKMLEKISSNNKTEKDEITETPASTNTTDSLKDVKDELNKNILNLKEDYDIYGTKEKEEEDTSTETTDDATITMSPNETLSNSLLSSIDPTNTTEVELKEAFCRDIDSFNWELSKPIRRSPRSSSGPRRSMGTIFGRYLLLSYILRNNN